MTHPSELLTRLKPYGQEHVLRHWESLTADERASLAGQIESMDLELVARLYRDRDRHDNVRALAERASPPPAIRLHDGHNAYSPAAARRAGAEALRAGRVGAILVAGGQGSRLGFEHPKGMYPVGPVSKKSLFAIHFERVLAASRKYGVRMPLYLMTSPATHDETVAYLDQQQRFGLPAEDLVVFCQGTMPAVDLATGRLLMDAPDHLFAGPDGHGGMLAAMVRSGALDDARSRGVEAFCYLQVDNPLADLADEAFIGYHILSGSEMTTQVIAKRDPLDRVGNVVAVDGHLQIIEYSDLPDDVARRTRDDDGQLEIWAGSIAVHVFSEAFLRRMASLAEALPFHYARKKVSYLDEAGKLVAPEKPNALKFERFIFDLLPHAANAIVVEIDPQEGFAPLKNAPGAERDTPEMLHTQMVAQHRRWLAEVGVTVAEGVDVEISPLVATGPDDLRGRVAPGTRIEEPTYIQTAQCLQPNA